MHSTFSQTYFAIVNSLYLGKVYLFENLRFHPGEELNDEMFSSALALSFDLYVNDAFGASHREHASVCGITKFFDICVTGLSMNKEVIFLKSIDNPIRPFALLIGGAKVSTKINVLHRLLEKVDKLLIGGAMVFTFWKALGYEVGQSLYEEQFVNVALSILNEASAKNVKVVLACDFIVANATSVENLWHLKHSEKEQSAQLLFSEGEKEKELSPTLASSMKTVSATEIPKEAFGCDIGATTISNFTQELQDCRTILWNGAHNTILFSELS